MMIRNIRVPGIAMPSVTKIARALSSWLRSRSARVALVALLSLSSLVSGCENSGGGEVEFQPVLVPVKFIFDESGIDIKGQKEIVTPVGTFSVGAKYSLSEIEDDAIYVIIRDRKEPPAGFDHTYQVRTGRGEFSAVVNGRTVIQVVDRQVLIDITDGSIEEIQLRSAEPAVATTGSNIVGSAVNKWSEYWTGSIYQPFSLFSWAYDDSTMSKWFGLGFVWFLMRLVLALLLLVVDLVLTGVFLVAGVAYVLFGDTARNIVYGVFSLLGILEDYSKRLIALGNRSEDLWSSRRVVHNGQRFSR